MANSRLRSPMPILMRPLAALMVLIGTLLALLSPVPVLAWGIQGHQTVAWIAQAQLSAAARANVARLLALEPGSTLESIASWPDEHRDSSNTHWHYVNFARDQCHYQPRRDCPGGQCVVAAIDAQYAILRSAASERDKLTALKFLVHLVGDIHQPLHAGFGDDRGGNQYSIQFDGEDSNLHALWDHQMVTQFRLGPKALAQKISADQANSAAVVFGTAAAWANQSCLIVSGGGFYPPHQVPPRYLRDAEGLVEQQLWRAGTRLAAMLNNLSSV